METPLVIPQRNPHCIAWRLFRWIACLLFAKTIGAVLYEYRWYFPLDFEQSTFLLGRENDFNGSYRVAFYTHLVAGPIALLSATFLMTSGLQRASRLRAWHPVVGKLQMVAVVPLSFSGFVMARNAFAGPIAGVAFSLLALFTIATCFAAGYYAMRRDFAAHRVWATRCFLLLCSPLLLRIVGGIAIVTELESEAVYRWNAWLSWSIPLLANELLRTNWQSVSSFFTSQGIMPNLGRATSVGEVAHVSRSDVLLFEGEANDTT